MDPLTLVVLVVVLLVALKASASTTSDAAPDVSMLSSFDGGVMAIADNTTPGIDALARAIAQAEGFGVAGAIPTRAHNPGDLVIPGWVGPTLGPERISVFDSDSEGWVRLRHQLSLIDSGKSKVYARSMTIQEMANAWTSTERSAWASNVASALQNQGYGIDENSTLADVFDDI